MGAASDSTLNGPIAAALAAPKNGRMGELTDGTLTAWWPPRSLASIKVGKINFRSTRPFCPTTTLKPWTN